LTNTTTTTTTTTTLVCFKYPGRWENHVCVFV
jgi:hypothetical protein